MSRLHSQIEDLEVRQVILENLQEEEGGEIAHPKIWLKFAESLVQHFRNSFKSYLPPEESLRRAERLERATHFGDFSMKCRIEIDAIRIDMNIGCTEKERVEQQPIEVQLAVELSSKPEASFSDQLNQTLDVGRVKRVLRASVVGKSVSTLERLAQLISEEIMAEFAEQIDHTWVLKIRKPSFGWSYCYRWTF